MKTSPSSLAIRQIRQEFSQAPTWVAIAGAGLVLAFAGAFGTNDHLRPIPLALYWVVIVALTYAAGSVASLLVAPRVRRWPTATRLLATGLASGLAVCVVIVGVNTALFGQIFDGLRDGAIFLATVFAVAMVVTVVFDQVLRPKMPPEAPAPPAILSRLPADKRGALVALTVEDHYVRVRTTAGEDLLLMRLGDAIKESGTGGLQVHRSHWVATSQVVSARRDGERAILTMSHGPEIPASRRYVPVLRDAGLLPRGKRDG